VNLASFPILRYTATAGDDYFELGSTTSGEGCGYVSDIGEEVAGPGQSMMILLGHSLPGGHGSIGEFSIFWISLNNNAVPSLSKM
jgi:hypothetical protein